MHSRLDYCNSVLAGLPQYSLNKLQSILRASARLVLKLPGSASVSDLMRDELHWLPVPLRIQFKLCCTVFKCLHSAAPPYLSEFCQPLSSLAGRYQLRSAAAGDLLIPPSKTVTIGASRIFDIRPSCLEWSSNKLERSYTNFSGLQETIENTLFHDDVNSGNAPLRRLFERRITNTSFNSIQFNSIHLLLQVFGIHCQTTCLPFQLFLFLEELSNITYSSSLTLTVVQNLARSNQLNVSHFVIQRQLLLLRRPETPCRPSKRVPSERLRLAEVINFP